jgi:mono/diheme cytochrome c family protein
MAPKSIRDGKEKVKIGNVKKTVLAGVLGMTTLYGAQIDAAAAFRAKCLLCHTTKAVAGKEKEKLLGPPVDEVLFHVKEKYPIKEDAVKFMADYIREPKVEKALCASMDKFGLMPAMKSTVSPEEAAAIASMLFDRFPRPEFARQEKKNREGLRFSDLDADGDGYVTPEEFRDFRARRNGIDPEKFKADLYFKKVDKNGDGRMSPEEFEAMRRAKAGKNQ